VLDLTIAMVNILLVAVEYGGLAGNGVDAGDMLRAVRALRALRPLRMLGQLAGMKVRACQQRPDLCLAVLCAMMPVACPAVHDCINHGGHAGCETAADMLVLVQDP
jgi:hypothetical protein